WRKHIPHFGRVSYPRIYPGIDVVYYGNQRNLEYDFIVAPGADPSAIRLQFEGANQVRLAAKGDLRLETAAGPFFHHRPIAYQQIDGKRIEVAAAYELQGRVASLRLGDYDHSKALIIDPVLTYSTYLGGGGSDVGVGIAVDATGAAYIT